MLESLYYFKSARNQPGGVLGHVDMGEDETRLGALGIKARLKCADQTEVRVGETLFRVGQAVIEERVCSCIGEEWGMFRVLLLAYYDTQR